MQSWAPVLTSALRALFVAASLLASSASPAQAPRPTDGLAQAVPSLLQHYARVGDFRLPSLTPAEHDALIAGEPVVTVFDDSGREGANDGRALRVAGMQVVHAPRLLVWLSVLGRTDRVSGYLTRVLLARRPGGAHVTYQHMDLPWPFRDRQWVILSEKNVKLADDSDGRIWEHRWSLLPDGKDVLEAAFADGRIAGVTREVLDGSVYLSANHGAWILFDLGRGKTLVAAYLDVDLGSQFPDTLVHSFTKRELRSAFESLRELNIADCDYDERPLLHDGRGLPISKRAVLEASGRCKDEALLVRTSAVDAATGTATARATE